MILNGLEAYSVMHTKNAKFVEIYGNLFGYQSTMRDNRTLYQVETVNIDTSAKGNANSVKPNLDALVLKTETMRHYWPHLEYLGDFHTHPYESINEVTSTELEQGTKKGDNKGYFLSQGDRKSLESLSEFYVLNDTKYRIGLLVTIAAIAADKGKEAEHLHRNCIQFNLKRHKLWITAYCAYKDGEKLKYTNNRKSNVLLECQSVIGNMAPFAPFFALFASLRFKVLWSRLSARGSG
jgi:hypothetical protein